MNGQESITLAATLAIIDSGQTFDIAFVTADRGRGTGGAIKVLSDCTKHMQAPAAFRGAQKAAPVVDAKVSKNPNHFENSTRNLKKSGSREIIKVHIRLITRLNNKRVNP